MQKTAVLLVLEMNHKQPQRFYSLIYIDIFKKARNLPLESRVVMAWISENVIRVKILFKHDQYTLEMHQEFKRSFSHKRPVEDIYRISNDSISGNAKKIHSNLLMNV